MPPSNTDHAELHRARWQAASVPGFFEQLIPDPELRKAALTIVAESILLANELDSSRWGITRYSKFARVNAGPTESVIVAAEFLAIMVDANAKAVTRRDLEVGLYRSAPNSAFLYEKFGSAKQLSRRIRMVWPAHVDHLSSAIPSGLNGAVRKGHDPSLVDEIRVSTGIDLPQPSYIDAKLRPSTPMPVDDAESASFVEGAIGEILQNRIERSSAARAACIEHYGAVCVVCDFDFGRTYGQFAEGLIHVHHLEILASREFRATDAVQDLRPVCPNCHLALHQRNPPIPIDELCGLLHANRLRLTRVAADNVAGVS